MFVWILSVATVLVMVGLAGYAIFEIGFMAGERSLRKQAVEKQAARWEVTSDGVAKFWWN